MKKSLLVLSLVIAGIASANAAKIFTYCQPTLTCAGTDYASCTVTMSGWEPDLKNFPDVIVPGVYTFYMAADSGYIEAPIENRCYYVNNALSLNPLTLINTGAALIGNREGNSLWQWATAYRNLETCTLSGDSGECPFEPYVPLLKAKTSPGK